MHSKSTRRRKELAGLSFSVGDLLTALSWAARHGLAVSVLLDRVIEEAEYEEMLVVTGRAQPFAEHVVWRTSHVVFEQHAGAPPRAFPNLHSALRALASDAKARPQRRRWFGLTPDKALS